MITEAGNRGDSIIWWNEAIWRGFSYIVWKVMVWGEEGVIMICLIVYKMEIIEAALKWVGGWNRMNYEENVRKRLVL